MHPFVLGMLLLAAEEAAPLPDAPTPTALAAAKMTLPDGFHATLFAGEPDVVKPIAMTFDDRGRLWVVESHSYPNWMTDGKAGNDRILIFEDTTGNGPFRQPHGLPRQRHEPVRHHPRLRRRLALRDAEPALHPRSSRRRRQPAGPPAGRARRLGPQGQAQRLQQPDLGPRRLALRLQRHPRPTRASASPARRTTSASPSTAASGAIIRPRKTSRPFARGTTNPWGLDFDDHGEVFITNCVIKHLFHVVPGAHFQRMYGQDLNPHVYDLMRELRRPHPLGRRRLDRRRAAARAPTARPAAATPTSAP